MKKNFSYKKPEQKQEHKPEKEIEKIRVDGIKSELKEQKKTALKEVKIKTGKYRYFCDACTNVAFWADVPQDGATKVCAVCGKEFQTKKENYILD